MNVDDMDDLTMRAPYIPMNEQDDLPLLTTDDFMWSSGNAFNADDFSLQTKETDNLQALQSSINQNINYQQQQFTQPQQQQQQYSSSLCSSPASTVSSMSPSSPMQQHQQQQQQQTLVQPQTTTIYVQQVPQTTPQNVATTATICCAMSTAAAAAVDPTQQQQQQQHTQSQLKYPQSSSPAELLAVQASLNLSSSNSSSSSSGNGLTKYAQLLAVIEEMGRDIRPTYTGSRTSTERLKRGIVHARILVRECLMETERSARQ
uniref:Cyclin-dependent kinase 2-associated protein n=1 Tax=Musca domestica TaxID=7370 RepID=T1PBA2_MUSDO